MPYLVSDAGDVLDLAPVASAANNQVVHELLYNVEAYETVCIEIELFDANGSGGGTAGAFSGTTVSALRGVSSRTAHFAAFSTAVDFTAAGAKFDVPVADIPFLLIKNVTPGSGTGKCRVRVWGRLLS